MQDAVLLLLCMDWSFVVLLWCRLTVQLCVRVLYFLERIAAAFILLAS